MPTCSTPITRTLDTNEKIYDAPYYNANNQIKQGTFTLGNFDYTHVFENKSSLTASFLYEYDDLYGTTHNHNLTEPGGHCFNMYRIRTRNQLMDTG